MGSPQSKEDIEASKKTREWIPVYYHWKYEADKNLAKRTAFKWTMLRPGLLSDESGVGTASIGQTHMNPAISVRLLLAMEK